MKFFLFYLCFFVSLISLGQNITKAELETYEDEELLDYFNEVSYDSIQAEVVARIYLERGRAEGDTIKMARGYDRLARIFNPKKNIQFADSVIALTKNIENITYPALGYMLKANCYNENGDLINMTIELLKAYEVSKKQNNLSQQVWILNALIAKKVIWGNTKDALKLQIQLDSLISTKEYNINNNKTIRKGIEANLNQFILLDRINSNISFAICYLQLSKYDFAEYYTRRNENLLKQLNLKNRDNIILYNYEILLEILYNKDMYEESIQISKQLLKDYTRILQPSDYFHIYKFLALSEEKKQNKFRSINYLNKSDSIFNKNQLRLHPADRIVFEKLLLNAKLESNVSKEIEMLTKLITIDNKFIENYKYFDPSMLKKYDIPKLIEEKEKLVLSLAIKNKKKSQTLWSSLLILAVSLVSLIYYFKRQELYKKRYEALMDKKMPLNKGVIALHENEVSTIVSQEIISEILEKLERFERDKQYLSMDINLHGLAKKLHTNQNYLSRVVNFKMEKNFSQYLCDLRIEYALEELKNNVVFRKYSVKAIANECGFKTAESFSKAFYKEVGIYPSYYIKNLEKDAM